MSYENKGAISSTVTVSIEPDRSGNFVCDGVADEVQINAAITYLATMRGGSIFLQSGVYNLAASVTLNDYPVAIRGQCTWGQESLPNDGRGTILRLVDGANTNVIDVTAVKCSVCHLVIDGNRDNQGGVSRGVYEHAGGASDFFMEYVYIIYIRTYAIHSLGGWCCYRYCVIEFVTDTGFIITGNRTQATDLIFYDCAQICMDVVGDDCIVDGMLVFWDGVQPTHVAYIEGDRNKVSGIIAGGTSRPVDRGVVIWGDGNLLSECSFDACDKEAVLIQGGQYNRILGNGFNTCSLDSDGGFAAIKLETRSEVDSTYNLIEHNIIYTVNANKPSYCIEEVDASQDYNTFKNNKMVGWATAAVLLSGPNSIVNSTSFQFIKELNGVYLTTAPTGIEIDADTEGAIMQGHIPHEAQEVERIRIYAVALDAPIGAGGQMHLEITFNAGSPNAAYNTAGTSWALANFDSEEADYVANDVVTWLIEDGDVSNEILALAPGDKFEMIVTHEAGADPDGATDAVFGSVEVEYV